MKLFTVVVKPFSESPSVSEDTFVKAPNSVDPSPLSSLVILSSDLVLTSLPYSTEYSTAR